MSEDADRTLTDWGLFVLAIVSAVLLAVGALLLLDEADPDTLFWFGVRVVVGQGLAILTVWVVYNRRWLAATFAALLSGITPLAAGWAWVAMLSIVLAVWSIALVWRDIVSGRNA